MGGNIDNLRRAAAAKQAAAVQRAEEGLRELIHDGAPITFEAVAARGGVSRNFLYRTPELRDRIEQLRDQQNTHSAHVARAARDDPLMQDASSVVRTLTAKLAQERQQHRREVAELRDALAVAHGELLTLRRAIPGTASASVDGESTTVQ